MELNQSAAKPNREFETVLPYKKRGMHWKVNEHFGKLQAVLFHVMCSDWTSPEDTEVYGDIISHITHIHSMYKEKLSDQG